MKVELGQTAYGQYKVAIVDSSTGQVVWEQPEWKRNLILNKGLAHVASERWAECFTAAIKGTSATANYTDSGATTAVSDAAGNVTLAGGSFTFAGSSADVDNIIHWDNGTEGRLVTTGSGTTGTITPAPGVTVSAAHFVLFRTNRTSLVAETTRTTTYLTGAGNCQSSISSNLVSLRRTYDFAAESGTVTYNEVGVGWSVTLNAANTTFARMVLASPLTLTIGQQLRLVYQLNIALAPTTSQSGTALVQGWPVSPSVNTDGTYGLQFIGMASVASGGNTSNFDGGNLSNEPSSSGVDAVVWLSTSSTALGTFAGSIPDRATVSGKGASLVSTDLTGVAMVQSKQGSWATGEVNGGAWRSMGVGDSEGGFVDPGSFSGFVFVFGQAQTKANTQTLTLAFKYTWSRTLVTD